MLTRAHRRELIRSQRRSDRLLPVVVRRLVAGLDPQPPWLPHRVATVLSSDLDRDAGVGAVRVVWRAGSSRAETFTGTVERIAGEWTHIGGGGTGGGGLPGPRRAVGQPGQVGILEITSESGARSGAHRQEAYVAPWIGSTEVQVAAEADHLLLGERRVDIPAHGAALLSWISPPGIGTVPPHPLIVAVAADGTELSRLAPGEALDSYTWRLLSAS